MKNKKILTFLSLAAISPFISLSVVACYKNNFNKNKEVFNIHKNFANDYVAFSYLKPNFMSKNLSEINLATSAKLFRFETKIQPQIDFRDNIVIKPSELKLKLEYAKNIDILSSDTTLKNFNNDRVSIVDYKNTEDKQEGIYYPKKDKGNGFNLPYLFVPSNSKTSINNQDFKNSLSNASGFDIKIKDVNQYWINPKGSKTQYKITLNDFKLGILKTALLNDDFRKEFSKKNNLKDSENEYKWVSDLSNNFNIKKWFETYQVDFDWLLEYSDDKLEFRSINNQNIDFNDFFYNLFFQSNYIDALPYEYISKKYGDPFKNLNWLKEYGKSSNEMLFASYYYVSSNDINHIKLIANNHYQKEQNRLKEINILFNQLPISNNTFGLQMYNAFLQNIVSGIDFDYLNISQKQELLKQYKKFNISYSRPIQKYYLQNKIINNYLPIANEHYFNNNFSKLYYGVNLEQLKETSNIKSLNNIDNLMFASLINKVINQYGFIQNNDEIWLSQAPIDLDIIAKNKGENYQYLKDAIVNINKPIIFNQVNNEYEFIQNNYQFKNKDYAQNTENISNIHRLKSSNFDLIKNQLNSIINDFYKQNDNQENIEFDIPIYAKNLSEFQKLSLKNIEKIFSSISSKLKARIVIIDNLDLYQEYFLKNKSIYKENNFWLPQANSESFISSIISSENSNLIYWMQKIKSFNFNKNPFKQLIKLYDYLSKNLEINQFENYNEMINFIKSQKENIYTLTIKWLKNIDLFDQISLINEINNLTSYIISYDNIVNIQGFYKTIYQNHIIKPVEYDGLNYLQDIKIKNK